MIPVSPDGTIHVDDSTDFDQLVRAHLAGGYLGKADAGDQNVETLDGLYARLSPPLASRLSRAMADCLFDRDASVRGQALIFFSRYPDAPGSTGITNALGPPLRELYAGKKDPFQPSQDFEFRLLHTLGTIMSTGDPAVIAAARAEVLKPGKGLPLVAALTCLDNQWLMSHLEEVVRTNPNTIDPIVYQFKHGRLKGTLDWIELLERIARSGITSQDFWANIGRSRADKVVRLRLEAILPSVT